MSKDNTTNITDALLRISECAAFRVMCCEDTSHFPEGCTAGLTHSVTGVYTLVSLKAMLSQNIIKAAAEIEKDTLLRILGRTGGIEPMPPTRDDRGDA